MYLTNLTLFNIYLTLFNKIEKTNLKIFLKIKAANVYPTVQLFIMLTFIM